MSNIPNLHALARSLACVHGRGYRPYVRALAASRMVTLLECFSTYDVLEALACALDAKAESYEENLPNTREVASYRALAAEVYAASQRAYQESF